jgi:group I intron endonuclease
MENKLKNSKSYIYNALLKHGHSNLSLTILEYCSPVMCIEREDYYLSILPHEYNICPKAGSRLGHKHSEESKKIMSDIAKKIKHSGHYKPGENHPNYGQKPEGTGKPSIAIEVIDITNNTTTFYDSIHKASIALKISFQAISIYFIRNQKKAL